MQFWASLLWERHELPGASSVKGHDDDGVEYLLYDERLGELGLLSLEKGDQKGSYQHV